MSAFVPDPNLLPLTDAARYIGCCQRTVRALVHEKRLPEPDAWMRFRRADLDAFRAREGYGPRR
jgi:excisionase family DNA binding protein